MLQIQNPTSTACPTDHSIVSSDHLCPGLAYCQHVTPCIPHGSTSIYPMHTSYPAYSGPSHSKHISHHLSTSLVSHFLFSLHQTCATSVSLSSLISPYVQTDSISTHPLHLSHSYSSNFNTLLLPHYSLFGHLPHTTYYP